MRNLSLSKTTETIELIGGIGKSRQIVIRNDGRNEHLIPFVNIFEVTLVDDLAKNIIPIYCYIYKRIGDSSVFGYCGVEKIPY